MSIQKHPFTPTYICHECGYDMHDRDENDLCPECGTLLDTKRDDTFANHRSLIVQASLFLGIVLMPLSLGYGVAFMIGGLGANHNLRKKRPEYRLLSTTGNRIKRIQILICVILIEFIALMTIDSNWPSLLFWW